MLTQNVCVYIKRIKGDVRKGHAATNVVERAPKLKFAINIRRPPAGNSVKSR